MILSKSYEEIMDKIEVTDEMRSRIMQNISNEFSSDESHKSRKKIKVQRFKHINKWISLAACLCVVCICAGVAIVHNKAADSKVDDENVMSNFQIAEYDSIDELADKVGFEIEDIDNLPFDVTGTSYCEYGEGLAEITYTGTDNEAIYRKSKGTEDVSGDYNQYEEITEVNEDGFIFTIKGNDSKYQLATWTKEGFSYSLYFKNGIEKTVLVDIAKRVN